MTDTGVSQDERLRAAFRRYAQGFEPVETEWVRVQARKAAAGRQRSPWWGSPRARVIVAVVLLLLAVLTSIGVTEREASVARDSPGPPPAYQSVAPAPHSPPGTTMAAIQSRGYVRVGVKMDQPGFGIRSSRGELQGFDVEIAKLLAIGIFGGEVHDLGSKIQFVEIASRDRESFIQSGKVDMVIATYSITPARQEQVDFAGPYFEAHQDIMVKKEDTSIHNAADLEGKKVCTVQGSTSYDHLRAKVPEASLRPSSTYSDCIRALLDGRVAAVTTDDAILAGFARGSAGLRLLHAPFSVEQYGIGLRKGDSALRDFLNARLAEIEANNDWIQAQTYTLQGIEAFGPPAIDR
jgi:glutamate transport system substrate-binding protein